MGEWAVLAGWQASPVLLRGVELAELRERLRLVGRAKSSLAAFEIDLVGEIARREGDAGAEEILRRDQKRSLAGARKAVKVAAQLEWTPAVAEKLADGAITPEAAALIAAAAQETAIDQGFLLGAAEQEADDLFRRTLKNHLNERTSDEELEARRARQRCRRRASISEEADGMVNLFATLDALAGARLRNALFAKADELFRGEDPQQRATPPQRLADALEQLVSNGDTNSGAPGAELLVLADYDAVHERLHNARLADGTRLTEQETLAIACDAKILPGIFNKHTGNIILGQSRRKASGRLRKRLIARDRGCIGCGASHKICEVHHIEHWQHDGPTNYDNTCLLCWRCHHIRVHLHGEQVTRHTNGHYTLQPPAGTPTRASPREPEELRGTAAHGPTTRPDPEPAPEPGGEPSTGTQPDPPTQCAPPARLDPGGDTPAAAGQIAGQPTPRRHEPGRPREHHPPTSGHRREPPDTPEPNPTSPASLPFPATGTATTRTAHP